MSKIKIVQIAFMGDEGATEYLDNYGRVWYEARKSTGKLDDEEHMIYKTVWLQVDLPEEPAN